MKQKFFTLLLGLAMVSVNAVADNIKISRGVGAMTYVSANNLDFSSFYTTEGEENDVTSMDLKPYYVSGYNPSTRKFTIKEFIHGIVPANTPMILLGKQYDSNKDEKESFDVPTISLSGLTAGMDYTPQSKVFSEGKAEVYMVPVIRNSYSGKTAYTSGIGGDDDGFYNNMEFYNYSSLDPAATFVYATLLDEAVVDVTTETVETWNPFGIYEITMDFEDFDDQVPVKATKTGYFDLSDVVDVTTGLPIPVTREDVRIVVHYPEGEDNEELYWFLVSKIKSGVLKWTVKLNGEALREEGASFWNSTYNGWGYVSEESQDVVTRRTYTQYILSKKSSTDYTPVFKKCYHDGTGSGVGTGRGSKVNVGSAYLRMWYPDPASAREMISFEFEDGDVNLIDDGETTGVKTVKDNTKVKNGIYTMTGQKLDKKQKGLNIVNGKIIYVK